jgi:hypothetical protein
VTAICACPFDSYSSITILALRKGVNSENVINQRVLAQIFARHMRPPGDLSGTRN